MFSNSLGKWALIDIETTGVDPANDDIIDLGFFLFEGNNLVRHYSSLSYSEVTLSHFIQKLTGITAQMVRQAPHWKVVQSELVELEGTKLVAHNAKFEQRFLEPKLTAQGIWSEQVQWQDSLHYLGLLYPGRNQLNLESFIVEMGIAQAEQHRGLSDARDMLKVLLLATYHTHRDQHRREVLLDCFAKFDEKDFWWKNFFHLALQDLYQMAQAIDFNLENPDYNDIFWPKKKPLEKKFASYHHKKDAQFNSENIQAILKDEKSIRGGLSSYRYRESQAKLALRVGQSFNNDVHALIQAPTGTGKTLGYLIPSALFAKEKKQQVLIATGTKTLQRQAMDKDVPILRFLLGWGKEELKVQELIGSSNHFCELLYQQNKKETDLLSANMSFEERFAQAYFDFIYYYNSQVENEQRLNRQHLPYALKTAINELVQLENDSAVDFRSCSGNKCPFKDNCSYLQSLREARDAHLIIGNHSLMLNWPRSFDRPSHIVVDEAHRIEAQATEVYGYRVDKKSLEHLQQSLLQGQGIGSLFYLLAQSDQGHESVIKSLREDAIFAAETIKDHLPALMEKMELLFKKMPRYTAQFWNELPMVDKQSRRDELSIGIYNHFLSLRTVLEDIYKRLHPYTQKWDLKELSDDNEVLAFTRFDTFVGMLEDAWLALSCSLDHTKGHTHTMRFLEEKGFELCSLPIDVGEKVKTELLDKANSVVFTSATLANADGKKGAQGIEWMTGYTYLEPDRRYRSGMYLPTPIDCQKQAKVFLCTDTPSMHQRHFVPHIMQYMAPLVRRLKGRTLFLFSARSRFEIAREVLLEEFESQIPLFIQGMGNQVVEEFKQSPSGILLGMESFAEGIDVPGDTLQLLFIDKVPDMRMDLVVQERRDFFERSFGNEFVDFFLAYRARSLHQKLGRLLRSTSDRGGAIIVDSRLKKWRGDTVNNFLRLMEPYSIEQKKLHEACELLENFILHDKQPSVDLTI